MNNSSASYPNHPVLGLIVATTENNVIGRNNGMPWYLPSDLQRFKNLTWGKPVIMGRRTWQSIGRPLRGRTNIVITRQADSMPATGIHVVCSLERAQGIAYAQARRDGVSEIFVIGGAEIFRLAFPHADRLYMTRILARIEGDTFFPAFDMDLWQEVTREDPIRGKKDTHAIQFVTYERCKIQIAKNMLHAYKTSQD